MSRAVRTFFTFQGGVGSAALDFYQDVFTDFELLDDERYGPDEGAPEGSIKAATFRIAGVEFRCSDSPIDHEWDFTPAISLWIDCEDEADQDRLFNRLSDDGQVFMPLGDYGFGPRFGWVGDRFGITWQLALDQG